MTIIVQAIASASARDYDWLKASVAGWLHRTDLGAVIPDFVMLAEKRISADLESRLAETVAMLITSPGVSSVILPDDFIEMKGLSLPGVGPLAYVTLATLDEPASVRSGPPTSYAVTGSELRLGPVPDEIYTLTMTYRGGIPALADNGGTNWLIEHNADLYLAATMCEALMYTRDAAELQKWEAKYAAAISRLNYNEWDSAGSLAMPNPS